MKESSHIVDDVLAALPPAGKSITMKEIHRAVDCWAPQTIKAALRILIKRGDVKRIDGNPPRFARAQ